MCSEIRHTYQRHDRALSGMCGCLVPHVATARGDNVCAELVRARVC